MHDRLAKTRDVIDALSRGAQSVHSYRSLPTGLRRAHLYVLYAIEELGGTARVTDIAAHTRVKVPNMTRLLKETEAAGWTEKAADPDDKRAVQVGLTTDGASCLKTYYWDYLDAIAAALQPDQHPEYDVMIEAIDSAVRAFTEATAVADREHPPGSGASTSKTARK